jgi:hypothetical protein
MALTLEEWVEIVLLSGSQGYGMLLKSEIFLILGRELETVVLLSIPIRTNMVKRLRKCVECRVEHIEHMV